MKNSSRSPTVPHELAQQQQYFNVLGNRLGNRLCHYRYRWHNKQVPEEEERMID